MGNDPSKFLYIHLFYTIQNILGLKQMKRCSQLLFLNFSKIKYHNQSFITSFENDQCAPENLMRSNKLLRYLYVTCYAVSDYGSTPHCLVAMYSRICDCNTQELDGITFSLIPGTMLTSVRKVILLFSINGLFIGEPGCSFPST